jgi:hypothetical protein
MGWFYCRVKKTAVHKDGALSLVLSSENFSDQSERYFKIPQGANAQNMLALGLTACSARLHVWAELSSPNADSEILDIHLSPDG